MKRTVVDLTPSTIRLFDVEGQGRAWRVRRLLVEPIQGADVGPRLARAARQQGFSRTVVAALPREQAITRLMKFPTADAAELAKMFELSGKAQLPYPPEQALADYRVLDEQGGTSLVQVIACRRDAVDRALALLRSSSLEPEVVTLSSWGLLSWYLRLGQEPGIREPVAIVNVDSDRTDLAMVRLDRLVFSRSLPQGLHDWQAGEGVGQLVQELERSLASMRKDLPGIEANSILLIGIGPLDQWKPAFEERMQRPVITKPVLPADKAGPGQRIDISTAVGVGLAIAERGWLVNLLPREVSQGQQQRRRVRDFSFSGVLLLVSLALSAGLLSLQVKRQERIVRQTMAIVKELESTTRQVERKSRDMRAVDTVLHARGQTAAMLAELLQRTPELVRFDSIAFERVRMEVTVRGSAPTTREVLNYVRQLDESTLWDRVELRYSSRRSVSAGARTDFEVAITQAPPRSAKAARRAGEEEPG